MKISFLLIICLQLFEYGESNFLVEPKWTWEESCRRHPFALAPGNPKIKNKFDKSCVLTFQYPKQLNLDGENNADIEEARDFCKKMYPDHVIKPTWDRDIITCPYQRNRHCTHPESSYPIGKYCVSVSTVAVNFEEAKKMCKQRGRELISTGDKDVIHFFSRLYKWNQHTPAIWATGSDNNKYQIFMGYSAIGNHRPGSSVIVEGETLKSKATVMCIGGSVSLPGGLAVPYCKKFLNDFLKISSQSVGTNCYYATQSLMVAKQRREKSKLASVDHFNTACKVRNGESNFVVTPTSTEQKNALISAVKGRTSSLLLPGTLHLEWKHANHEYVKQTKRELFSYYIIRKTENDPSQTTTYKIGVPTDGTWKSKEYPIEEKGFMERSVLMWGPEKMINVDAGRRAPVLCGSGIAVVSQFQCPAGYQKADRENSAICFMGVEMECPSVEKAREKCKTKVRHDAKLAPMDSGEEEMAIVRATIAAGIPLGNNVVLIGGEFFGNHKKFITEYDLAEVGKNYNRWITGEPSRTLWCKNRGAFKPKLCFHENCVTLRFHDGAPIGLNDVQCDDACKSTKLTKGIVCAIPATRVNI